MNNGWREHVCGCFGRQVAMPLCQVARGSWPPCSLHMRGGGRCDAAEGISHDSFNVYCRCFKPHMHMPCPARASEAESGKRGARRSGGAGRGATHMHKLGRCVDPHAVGGARGGAPLKVQLLQQDAQGVESLHAHPGMHAVGQARRRQPHELRWIVDSVQAGGCAAVPSLPCRMSPSWNGQPTCAAVHDAPRPAAAARRPC